MGEPVRVAQVGVLHSHAAAYRESLLHLPEARLVACYDPDPAAARARLEPALADVPLYDRLPELLARERPEAVLVTLPSDAEPAAVVACADAGVHCFVEKPVARSAAELAPVEEAIRRNGVAFHLGYTRRFTAPGSALRGLVEQGLLGEIRSVEGRWITTSVRSRDPAHYAFSRARSGGGILHWLGCHWLDLMRYVTGLEVVGVSGVLATLSGEAVDVEDTAALSLRFANGAVGSLHAAYTTGGDDLYFGLRGALGWARWERSLPEITAYSEHPLWNAAPRRTLTFRLPATPGYGGAAGRESVRRFFAAFREGKAPMFTTEDARRVLEVLDAAAESSRTGRYVPLGPG
jgi:predicted dehydrogenase